MADSLRCETALVWFDDTNFVQLIYSQSLNGNYLEQTVDNLTRSGLMKLLKSCPDGISSVCIYVVGMRVFPVGLYSLKCDKHNS